MTRANSCPDFTRPQSEISINGFPVRFRKENLDGKTILWVPRRISRNDQSKGWRILINHEDGQLALWEPDEGREPLESLRTAWKRMVAELGQLKSTITNMRRPRNRGPSRIPALDSGVDGVLIVRSKPRPGRSKAVGVSLYQWLLNDDGKQISKGLRIFSISESKFLKDPAGAQRRFNQALCIATAIRRKYLEAVAAGGTPDELVTRSDLKKSDVPKKPAKAMALSELFDSFDAG